LLCWLDDKQCVKIAPGCYEQIGCGDFFEHDYAELVERTLIRTPDGRYWLFTQVTCYDVEEITILGGNPKASDIKEGKLEQISALEASDWMRLHGLKLPDELHPSRLVPDLPLEFNDAPQPNHVVGACTNADPRTKVQGDQDQPLSEESGRCQHRYTTAPVQSDKAPKSTPTTSPVNNQASTPPTDCQPGEVVVDPLKSGTSEESVTDCDLANRRQSKRVSDQGAAQVRWITISEAARISGINKGTIGRAADTGELLDNGKKVRERRIDAQAFVQWQLSRTKSEPAESDAQVKQLTEKHVKEFKQ
jgi:hypothetical protein